MDKLIWPMLKLTRPKLPLAIQISKTNKQLAIQTLKTKFQAIQTSKLSPKTNHQATQTLQTIHFPAIQPIKNLKN